MASAMKIGVGVVVGALLLTAGIAQGQTAGERFVVQVLSAPYELDLDMRTMFYPYPFAPTDSIAKVYRQRLARYSLRLEGLSELDAFRTALAWSGTRWLHHSDNTVPASVTTLEMLERAQNGERFTCVEYARLLVDALVAYGYPARIVGLSKHDIELRPRAARHVAVEAWSYTLGKWVFLDPQWGIYPCLDGLWLNAYELVSAIRAGKLNSIEFIPCEEVSSFYRNTPVDHAEHYRSFIAPYTGYLDYPYVFNGQMTLLMLICDDALAPPLSFQGMPLSGLFYTRNWRKIYGALDQVHLTARYTGTYNAQRGFLDPEYTLQFATTVPWVAYWRVRCNGQQWVTLREPSFRWKLQRGINTIEVQAISYAGEESRSAIVRVFYGPRDEVPQVTTN